MKSSPDFSQLSQCYSSGGQQLTSETFTEHVVHKQGNSDISIAIYIKRRRRNADFKRPLCLTKSCLKMTPFTWYNYFALYKERGYEFLNRGIIRHLNVGSKLSMIKTRGRKQLMSWIIPNIVRAYWKNFETKVNKTSGWRIHSNVDYKNTFDLQFLEISYICALYICP